MKRLLFLPVAAGITLLQALPLASVAWLGRRLGALAWWVDWRHRRQALVNLDIVFGTELSPEARERIARDNFRRLGESFLCAIKTAGMDRAEVGQRLQVVGLNKIRPWIERSEVPGIVIATGHFGNIEMYDFVARELPWMEVATVYQRSANPIVNRVLERVRRGCRCRFFEAGDPAQKLRAVLREGNVVLGLMADVSAGPRGLAVPMFNQPASTSVAPAVYALRFRMPLHAAVCYRSAPGRWRVEISDEIPTRANGRARPVPDIVRELNRYFERSIRRDPANWCWPHARWEHGGRSRTGRGSRSSAHE